MADKVAASQVDSAASPPAADRSDRPRRRLLVPRSIAAEVALWRELGLRAYVRKRGVWFFAAIIAFYLVRDSVLYIIIPYLALRGIIQCPGPLAP